MKNRYYDLQLFDDAAGTGDGAQTTAGTGNGAQQTAGGKGTYSFEQAEEIANARADRASKAALASYFKQQGMTEEQVAEAIRDFQAKQKASAPDVAALTKERDELQAKLAAQENEKLLRKKGVREDDIDYVAFKVAQKVDDKTSFEKAADAFLKENPRFTGSGVKVSMSTETTGTGTAQSTNETINDAIRRRSGVAV